MSDTIIDVNREIISFSNVQGYRSIKYLKSFLLLLTMYVCRVCDNFHAPENMKPDLSTHTTPLSLELSKLKVKQTVIAWNSEISSIRDIDIYSLKHEWPFSMMRAGLTAYKKIKELNRDFDVIHYHNPAFSSILLKKSELPPIVMTLHDSPIDIKNNMDFFSFKSAKEGVYYYHMAKYAAKRVDALVCVSTGVTDSLIRNKWVDPERIITISTAVDVDIFHPKPVPKCIDMLFVGRFVGKKRPFDFLRTVSVLKKEYPSLKATMVGGCTSDYLYDDVLKWIESHDLSRNVSVVSPVSQSELSILYSSSKVLLLPSISEGLSKATLEAMACGIPVVATDILGNKDISVDGRTGYLVKVKNPHDMAEKVKILLNDDSLRKRMGAYGARTVAKNYTWNIVSRQYLKLYESLI